MTDAQIVDYEDDPEMIDIAGDEEYEEDVLNIEPSFDPEGEGEPPKKKKRGGM